jgi:hypothetical protein
MGGVVGGGKQALALLLGLPVVASLGAALTAFVTGQPWVVIYLAAWGAFAYALAAALCIVWLRDRFSIFRGISLVDVGLKHAVMTGTSVQNVTVHGVLENRSKSTVSASHKRAILTLQNKTGSDLQYPTMNVRIDPGRKEGFVFPIIDSVDGTKEARGHIDLEVYYGRSEAHLRYVYECRCEIALLIREVAPAQYDVTIANAVRRESHRKL